MEHLDPIETARRILAGESLVENNIVEDEVDEIVVEDFEDLDIEEVEEMAHGNKKKMKKAIIIIATLAGLGFIFWNNCTWRSINSN